MNYIYLAPDGRYDAVSTEEVEAVERSGRSSWQSYALTPSTWPEPSSAVVPLMEGRPGAVEPWVRPVEGVLNFGAQRTWEEMEKGVIHWQSAGRAVCDGKWHSGAMYGSKLFKTMLTHPRVCARCEELYGILRREGLSWQEWEDEVLLRLWPHVHRRQEVCHSTERTYNSCRKRYWRLTRFDNLL